MTKPKKFATVRNLGTRLEVGMVIRYGGDLYRVVLVNECRARCEPIDKKRQVEISTRFGADGKPVKFEASSVSINISPNSECEIVHER